MDFSCLAKCTFRNRRAVNLFQKYSNYEEISLLQSGAVDR